MPTRTERGVSMSDLYEVYLEGDDLPIAANLPEAEAYDLNLRMEALRTLYSSLGSRYRSNPSDEILDLERGICQILGSDSVPASLGAAKRLLKEQVTDRNERGRLTEGLQSLYSDLDKARSQEFLRDMLTSLTTDFEDKFGVVLNDGTLASVLACRASDFKQYFGSYGIGYKDLNARDQKYIENLLFMLEAFRNITDEVTIDIDPRFYEALALFDKKALVEIVHTLNYVGETDDGEPIPREYTSIVGGHYSPPLLLILHVMSVAYADNRVFSRWLKSESFSTQSKAESVSHLLARAIDNAGDFDIGQGELRGSSFFTADTSLVEKYQGLTKFTLDFLEAAKACIFGKGKVGKVTTGLDLNNEDEYQSLLRAFAAAEIGTQEENITSKVAACFTLAFAMTKISNQSGEREVLIYNQPRQENDQPIRREMVRTPSALGRFKGALKSARTPMDIVDAVVANILKTPPLIPRDIYNQYMKVDISPKELKAILPNEEKPKIRNLSYMRWMANLYRVSTEARSWGTSAIDDATVKRLLEDSAFDKAVSAMLYYIREQRISLPYPISENIREGELRDHPYVAIINNTNSQENPFLQGLEEGFNYYWLEKYNGNGVDFSRNFLNALRQTEHYDAFEQLFPHGVFATPSAISYGFMGAVLSPHYVVDTQVDNFNDIRMYRCRELPHGDIEKQNIEVWQTAALNPVCLITGHTQLSNCCMYPKAVGATASLSDFLRPEAVSTLYIFDMYAKNKGNPAFFKQKGDVVCLGTVYNARTFPTLENASSKISNEYALRMIEGETKLYLQLNEPVPYIVNADGTFETPVSTLDGWELQTGDAKLVSQTTLGYNPSEIAKAAVYDAISNDPELNYMIAGVYSFASPNSNTVSSSSMGIRWQNARDNVYTDGQQSYSEVRESFFGSKSIVDASSSFRTMVVSFDNEGDTAVVGYTALDGTEVPQVEVSWDYLRYMFSFPMGNAFVPFEGSVIFDTSPRNESVCLELLTPSWFASADEKPLVRGDNSYDQADLIAMRTPQGGAFIGREQIL